LNAIIAGAAPKATISARLSSSAPNEDEVLVNLAILPSSVSRIIEKTIAIPA
jgi:hypothetical protein